MSALTIGLAAAGTIIGVGLVYYGLKGSGAGATGAGAGAGAGAAPYVPTTYDNLEGPRQQVYGGRGSGRKSKRMTTARSKRTDVSRRRRRSKH
jgi:hypothetical protein